MIEVPPQRPFSFRLFQPLVCSPSLVLSALRPQSFSSVSPLSFSLFFSWSNPLAPDWLCSQELTLAAFRDAGVGSSFFSDSLYETFLRCLGTPPKPLVVRGRVLASTAGSYVLPMAVLAGMNPSFSRFARHSRQRFSFTLRYISSPPFRG